MILAVVIGLCVGLVMGLVMDVTFPPQYSFYITVALLAALDSIFGAVRSQMEDKYNMIVFLSGFVMNTILAGLLAFLGDKLGVPLYYAAILVFGGRLFNNLAIIRRIWIDKYIVKK